MANYSDIKYQPAGSATTTYSDMAALIAATGMSAGDQALVTALNKVFMYTGSAWYLVATMTNDSPTAITGVDGTYTLATDGTATTVTAVSTDPEGFPLTWSYAVTTGSLGSTATVSQTDNVFTITPSTTEADAGSFSITFSVTDGETGAVSAVSAFTLSFIVTNSRYTALSVKATNTGSNQTFDDASTSNHTITASGDVTASTFSPYRHGGYSAYFDGTGDYLTLSPQSDFAFGTGDFSISLWVYFNDAENYDYLIDGRNSGQTTDTWSLSINFTNGASNKLMFASVPSGGSATAILTSDTDFVTGQWYYITVSRSGTTSRMHFNGTQVAINTSDSTNYSTSPNTSYIGTRYSLQQYFDGYMCDVRVVKGTALSSYTPPTAPLTAITNTKFLLGRLPYFKDQSASNHAITPNGNVSLEPISLFDNASYSEADHGASVYFDGTGDYLDFGSSGIANFGTGDFTIEFWINSTDANALASGASNIINPISSTGSGYWGLLFQNGKLRWNNSYNVANLWEVNASTTILNGSFNHIAVVRNSGAFSIYFNGVSQSAASGTFTDTTNYSGDTGVRIGSGNANDFVGTLSDLRIVSSAVYTSNFTPPTESLTAITNTKFLLNPETSISDLSQRNALICRGDVETSTTQVKFAGTKSIYFSGSDDYIHVPNSGANSAFSLNSTKFTIEGWFYKESNAGPNWDQIISKSRWANNLGWGFKHLNDGTFTFEYSTNGTSSSSLTSTGTLGTGAWAHVALVANNNLRLYINGVGEVLSASALPAFFDTTYDVLIGATRNDNTDNNDGAKIKEYRGWMQDLRIHNNHAQYTANFTPPTTELEG